MGPNLYSYRIHLRQEPRRGKKEATLLVCFSEPGKSQTSCSILARDLVTVGGFLGIWAKIQLCLLFSLQCSKSVAYSFSPQWYLLTLGRGKGISHPRGMPSYQEKWHSAGRRYVTVAIFSDFIFVSALLWNVTWGITESPADDPQQTHQLWPVLKTV